MLFHSWLLDFFLFRAAETQAMACQIALNALSFHSCLLDRFLFWADENTSKGMPGL
jgi:hypothetical protein